MNSHRASGQVVVSLNSGKLCTNQVSVEPDYLFGLECFKYFPGCERVIAQATGDLLAMIRQSNTASENDVRSFLFHRQLRGYFVLLVAINASSPSNRSVEGK